MFEKVMSVSSDLVLENAWLNCRCPPKNILYCRRRLTAGSSSFAVWPGPSPCFETDNNCHCEALRLQIKLAVSGSNTQGEHPGSAMQRSWPVLTRNISDWPVATMTMIWGNQMKNGFVYNEKNQKWIQRMPKNITSRMGVRQKYYLWYHSMSLEPTLIGRGNLDFKPSQGQPLHRDCPLDFFLCVLQSRHLYLCLPCGQRQHKMQLYLTLPCGQPAVRLHTVHQYLSLPCGQPLHCKHWFLLLLPQGHLLQCLQFTTRTPCSQVSKRFRFSGLVPFTLFAKPHFVSSWAHWRVEATIWPWPASSW